MNRTTRYRGEAPLNLLLLGALPGDVVLLMVRTVWPYQGDSSGAARILLMSHTDSD